MKYYLNKNILASNYIYGKMKEANRLSEELLIKRSDWNKFILNGVFTKESIERFAKKIVILPCIVLGRLHKEKIIPYGVYDKDFNVSYRSIYEYYIIK